jgi:hypothetical protein
MENNIFIGIIICLSFFSLLIGGASAGEWSVPVTFASGDSLAVLHMGTSARATAGFDMTDMPNPPFPPTAEKYAFFSIEDDLFPMLRDDFRPVLDGGNPEERWVLVIASDDSIHLSWDTTALAGEKIRLKLETGDESLAMTDISSYSAPAGLYTLDITAVWAEDGLAAEFSADPLAGQAPLTVQFTDLSSGDPTSWRWEFGDGGSSQERNPIHVYTDTGMYSVSLSIQADAASDFVEKSGYIVISGMTLPVPGCSLPPTDPDDDGLCEDINGNGRCDFDDVVKYYRNMGWIESNEPLKMFDFNDNGRIDFNDVVLLYHVL